MEKSIDKLLNICYLTVQSKSDRNSFKWIKNGTDDQSL